MQFGTSFERRQADLFFRDLGGQPPRSARARQPSAAEWLTEDDGGDLAEDTFTPENLAPDMKGLEFVLTADADVTVAGAAKRMAAGTVVTATAWDNTKTDIEATIGGSKARLGKDLITPKVTMYKATVTTAKGSREVESMASTAGKYLVETSAVMTRFNVLQAVDSRGPQQFLMMKEIEPDLLKSKGLEKVIDHQAALEEEWTKLEARKTRTARQQARLDYLDTLRFSHAAARRSPTWGPFVRKYPDVDITPKPSAKTKSWDVVTQFLNGGSPQRKYDYSFWIRTGVRWLFEKRKGVSTWSDAVRAFNGIGGRADFYRAVVLTRARAAAGAAGIIDDVWGGYNCPPEAKTKDGAFRVCAFERVANVCEPRC